MIPAGFVGVEDQLWIWLVAMLRPGAAFRPWLFTIVANEARNRRRSMSRRASLELRVRDEPRPTGAGSDTVAAEQEQRRLLVAAVNNLPDHHREVVALRFFAGLTESETAEVLACPAGTAKSRLSRALDHLRAGGENLTLNCGYGRGYSVKEVTEVVKQVSGVDFPVRLSPRRPGDPAALVAKADRIRAELGWQPEHDDLTEIVTQALAWEESLRKRNAS